MLDEVDLWMFEMKSYEELEAEVNTLNDSISDSPYLNNLDLLKLRDFCEQADPFRYVCIDGMWKDEFLEQVMKEVAENQSWAGEKQFYGSREKRWQADWNKFPEHVHSLLSYLNQPLVLKIIEFITQEKFLVSDPYLEGGGIHSTGNDGFLKLHADFNWNEKLQLYRRINILVYLNKDWKKEYGGQIELAGKDSSGEFISQVALEPIFNRTLIFVTDDKSFHGQPNPVNHPDKKRRNSIAAYYYTAAKPDDSSDTKRIGTNYVGEDGKSLQPSLSKRILARLGRVLK